MKVTIVVGGRWHAFDLARGLLKNGILHRIITTYPKFKTRTWDIPDDKVISIPLPLLVDKLLHRLGGRTLSHQAQTWIHKHFARQASHHLEGSDILHGWSAFSLPSLQWCTTHRIPSILEHSSAHIIDQARLLRDESRTLSIPSPIFARPAIMRMEMREYRLASRIMACSTFVADTFSSRPKLRKKLIINPLGVNLSNFKPGKKTDSTFRIIYAGMLTSRKGIHYLIKAFNQAAIPQSELLLVGSPTSETPRLLQNASKNTRLTGHLPQNELATLYQQSSVFILPSIEDGFGMVMSQALACGLPIIATTHTGARHLLELSRHHPPTPIEHGILQYPAGFLIPPRSPQAIAHCLRLLASQPGLLTSQQQAVSEIPLHQLDWDSYIQRCIHTYKQLLHHPSPL